MAETTEGLDKLTTPILYITYDDIKNATDKKLTITELNNHIESSNIKLEDKVLILSDISLNPDTDMALMVKYIYDILKNFSKIDTKSFLPAILHYLSANFTIRYKVLLMLFSVVNNVNILDITRAVQNIDGDFSVNSDASRVLKLIMYFSSRNTAIQIKNNTFSPTTLADILPAEVINNIKVYEANILG